MRLTIDIDHFVAATKMVDDSPAAIRAARTAAGLTQAQAAQLVGLGDQARWAEYESSTNKRARRPGSAVWQLFLLLTDQHPTHKLTHR